MYESVRVTPAPLMAACIVTSELFTIVGPIVMVGGALLALEALAEST